MAHDPIDRQPLPVLRLLPPPGISMYLRALAIAGLVGLGVPDVLQSAAAQPEPAIAEAESLTEKPEPEPAPSLAPSVERLLAAPYLTDEEKRDIRLFHGVWLESDLDAPARAAAAAVARGEFRDPSIDFPSVDPLVRIRALIGRGDYSAAAQAIDALPRDLPPTIAEFRLRAEVLEARAQFQEAAATCDLGLAALAALKPASPADIVEGVRLLDQRIRLIGTGPAAAPIEQPGAHDGVRLKADPQAYHQMLQVLGEVRSRVNVEAAGPASSPRLYWPALLAEAEILYSRDNAPKAHEALTELLALNPSCVPGWALLGRMSVDAFNFEATERIAQRLDIIAGHPAPGAPTPEGESELEPVPGSSIDAAIIRARAALRQIDGARAAELLDAQLEKYPDHPRVLAVRAAAEAVRFEFDALKQRLADFDRRYPGSPVALYEVGRALAESRQYAESAAMLTEAHRRLPAAHDILAELGLMYVQFGKDELALDALERAHDLDPFDLRVDNSLRLVRELLTYDRIESEHFIVKFKPGIDEVFAHDILAGMEFNHALVTGDGPGGIDHQPFGGKGKTVIDLMPDHQWFGVRIAGMPAIHTIAASTGPVIAMEAPREGANHLGNYDWLRVLRHEYTHTVNLDRTRNRIPHWFTEASAVYLELSPRDYSTCTLLRDAFEADALFDFVEINIAFVRPRRPADRSLAYAQGHWMYEFMIERWGNKAPLDLMDLYAAGVREEQAFNTVLGMTRSQFLAEFKPWARRQLIAWGMLPPPSEPSLKDLLSQVPGSEEHDQGKGPTLSREVIAGWLEKHPAHPDVLEMAVAQALDDAGGRATAEMIPLLERYAAARPVDPKPHRLLAQMYLASPDAAEQLRAIEHLEFLDQREQKSTAYATELARRYFARGQDGDLARALAKAERATQIAPYEAPPRELAATIAIKARDFPGAERHILALTRLEPDRPIHLQRLEALRKLRATP